MFHAAQVMRHELHCVMRISRPTSTLLLLGVAGVLTGVAFKLNHLMGAETVFNIGSVMLVGGLLSAIRDVWKNNMG